MCEQYSYRVENEEAQKPYVVSGDIGILLDRWSKARGIRVPDERFINSLRKEFTGTMTEIFPAFELVDEGELTDGLSQLVQKTAGNPVSLDGVYYPTSPGLQMSRNIGSNLQDRGLFRRANTDMLVKQFRDIQRIGFTEVQLVDDVLFTGDMLTRIIAILQRMNISITGVNVGIAVGEGIDKLTKAGIPVRAVRIYPEVIDEICERDFYPGIAYSGRTLIDNNQTGVPYLLPFGKPVEWASIQQNKQKDVSCFCLEQTIKLFEEIERLNGRPIVMDDLERQVVGISSTARFVDALKVLTI